jgi:hypothetical protein
LFDREKFKRLVHYVIAQAGHKPGFGATKLNKVLWFADARRYVLSGKPITGATYTRQEFGPVPSAILPVRRDLQDEGKIRVIPQKAKFEGTRFESLRPPEAVGFVDDEKQIVDFWIRTIADDHTAASISEESHDYAWEIAKMGEPLPYHAYLANRLREPSDEEMEWARASAKRLGLI